MLYGAPYTTHYGELAEGLLEFNVERDGNVGAICSLLLLPGVCPYWAIVVDGVPQVIVYLQEGILSKNHRVVFDSSRGEPTVSPFPLGDWDTYDDIDVTFEQTEFQSDKGKSVRVTFPTVMQVESDTWNDAGQLTGWALNGLQRFANCLPISYRASEVKVLVELLNVGSVRTVNLYVGAILVATGSRTGNGSIDISEQNESGISGTVNVAYSADIALGDGAYVLGRWAEKYVVACGSVSKTVFDTGSGNTISVVLEDLPAGVRTVSVTAYSDTKIVGAPKTDTINVPGRPEAPGELSYVDGDWTDTKIEFQASATPGAIYALYDVQELDGPIAVCQPAALAPAGTGTIQWILPSLPSAGTGTRRLYVVAINNDIEDGVKGSLKLDYVAGVVTFPRPNIPDFVYAVPDPVTAGRTIHVQYTYNAANQTGIATKVLIWLLAEGDAVPADGETPDAQLSIAAAVNGISRGNISATAPADGYYRVLVRTAAADGTQSNNSNPTSEIYASNAVPAAAASLTLEVIS